MTRKFHFPAAFALAGSLVAGCSEAVRAQEEPAKPSQPAPTPPVKADEPTKPVDQRPMDEGAIRALAEEVARLRAQIAEMQKVKDAPMPLPARPAESGEEKAAPVANDPSPSAPVVTEREVPVYVDREVVVQREVPVYVDRQVVVETQPSLLLEHVTYGDAYCDQWIPYDHYHYIGCGHHYYGCSCHPWYYSLCGSGISLSFSYFHDDHHHDDHHDGHHDDHHDGGHGNGKRQDGGGGNGGHARAAGSDGLVRGARGTDDSPRRDLDAAARSPGAVRESPVRPAANGGNGGRAQPTRAREGSERQRRMSGAVERQQERIVDPTPGQPRVERLPRQQRERVVQPERRVERQPMRQSVRQPTRQFAMPQARQFSAHFDTAPRPRSSPSAPARQSQHGHGGRK